MPVAVTQGIRVSVLARYEAAESRPDDGRYLFSYRIAIANHGRRPVQLLHRHWTIIDSLAPRMEVEGPGVVGNTPVMEPGEQYMYSSFCELHSGFGRMQGSYRMRHLDDGSEFDVAIPAFDLYLPHAAN